ncbi:MAG: heparinase II/III domain-containing protein [Bacteroidota bacterium]
MYWISNKKVFYKDIKIPGRKNQVLFFILIFLLPNTGIVLGQSKPAEDEIKRLNNPVTVTYLQKHLKKRGPRLVLTQKIIRHLKKDIKKDPVVSNVYQAIKLNANDIMSKPLLEREVIGRRLLATSREMLYRMNMLGMVYVIENDPKILERINREVAAVCHFSDWNPSHFLDVAEMSLAVSLAIDWTAGELPDTTIQLAKKSLIEKGLEPSFTRQEGSPIWVNSHHNWNQVCHGGMIAAALTIAENDWNLAVKTLSRALDNIPYALEAYGPDGVYPEGSTYWSYGTSFTIITSSMFKTALGTDFGISDYPSFKESAVFRVLSVAPSGWYYNFADCGDERSKNGDFTLAWFAAQTGKKLFYEKQRFLHSPEAMGTLHRLAGTGLVYLSKFEEKEPGNLPEAWKGEGINPVVIIQSQEGENTGFYLGAKGGRATSNHGNMDAGSFIFELQGVRWIVDPGNQPYHELEKIGFNLWETCQECDRWKLLTKNNFGHSTLTVNNALYLTDGFASLTHFEQSPKPSATFELTPVFDGLLEQAQRTFLKESKRVLLITDSLVLNGQTQMLTWQALTTAEVETFKGGAILRKDGKEIKLEVLSHPHILPSIISLDPPPLSIDRRIEGLKRIEIQLPSYLFKDNNGIIQVRIAGE